MALSRNQVAAHLIVFINGRMFGEATSFRFSSQTPHKANHGLDQLEPYELMPVGTKVTGTIGSLRLRNSGGLEGRGIVAPFSHVGHERYFSILVMDRTNGTAFFRAENCKVLSQDWDVQPRQRVMGQFTFEGIFWGNESQYP